MIDEAMMLRECIYNLSGQDPQETKAVMQAAASKIDELRAALQERDAEIRLLKASDAAWKKGWVQAETKLAAQRRVLEQALEALTVGWSPHFTGKDARELGEAAITAIQEQLK